MYSTTVKTLLLLSLALCVFADGGEHHEPDTTELERSFLEWCIERGTQHNLEIAYFEQEGGEKLRGVAAAVDIKEGETIVEIPIDKLFSPANAKKSDLAQIFNDRNVPWTDDMMLTVWFMYEILQHNSPWEPYLNLVQQSPVESMAIYWDDEVLGHYSSNLIQITHQRLARISNQYAALFPYLSTTYSDIFGGENAQYFTWAQFKWAWALISSRYWYLPIHGEHHKFMVPMADLINFGDAYSTAEIDEKNDSFKIVAQQDFNKGDQIFFWYTDDCQDWIWVEYGFSHPSIAKCEEYQPKEFKESELDH
eukprot:TRINITY_DN61505_c0_g1_i1.p2 TRINITY_DN61505_c0_g1~~TRINITY_DN61505_c0_g1_i1.p2  ORF type:complete len:308 (-),score=33.74 TRINITY_DN61505_c0_g1_i1:1543-2466(-)